MFKKILKGSAALLVVTIAASGASVAEPAWKIESLPQANDTSLSVEQEPTVDDSEWNTEFSNVTRIDPRYGNLDAFYGNLDAFWGNLDAFWGNLDAFDGSLSPQYGSLDAFYGNLDAFYGNLDAFYGNLDAFWGSLDAFYGNLDAFYGSLDAFYGNLDAFYGNLDAFADDPAALSSNLQAVFTQAETSFGAAVEGQTGVSFSEAVTQTLLAKYGISSDFSGAENLTQNEYAILLLELHDCVMSFTGLDHLDHWMNTVNWSPRISLAAGSGAGVTVGILDTQINDMDMLETATNHNWGYRVDDQHHGAAVASIIAAAHDGQGVMGIAPSAEIVLDNPFDETFTAGWGDIKYGINSLASNAGGANVINMSLGVSGWTLHQDWTGVFGDSMVQWYSQNVVFVKAAGNDGAVQSADIEWGNLDAHNRLLIVGSVDPNGNISSFSNTPGEACLLVNGACDPANMLKNRFLVAPGEIILVSDNAGGITRTAGTSFSAPMVTGAVALVQSRWQWLQQNPEETAEVILRSATDLGDPGVDGTYGWGLLNIEASQAPLNPNALVVETANGPVSVNELGGLTQDMLGLTESNGTVTALEYIGDTYRDFDVEVSGIAAPLAAGADSELTTSEEYLAQRVATSMETTSEPAPEETTSTTRKGKKKRFASFTDRGAMGAVTAGNVESTWSASFSATRRDPNEVVPADAVGFQMGTVLHNNANGLTLMFGEGQGALAFSAGSEFGMTADHDIRSGGVNPFLGLASGGFYSGAAMPLGDSLTVSFGFTQDTDRHEFIDPETGEIRDTFTDVEDYQASAMNIDFGYALSSAVEIKASYTQLHEATGLLGGQGAGAFALEGGATTDAMTLGADAELGNGFSFSASATAGKTRSVEFDNSILSVAEGGITSTAFQIAASKHGVFGDVDRMRLSFAQPLHLESGALGVTAMQVVDRTTGELGLVTDQIALTSAKRRFVSELLYATPIMGGNAFISAFGQVELNNVDLGAPQTAVTGGGRIDIRF